MLVAHRGAMAVAPENTAYAFDIALSNRIDGIEFDVRLTADGIPVIFHDDNLFRVTGHSGSIMDYTFNMLVTLDYGKWFSDSFKGAMLMRFDQILMDYAQKTNLLIELKTDQQGGVIWKRKLVVKIIEAINQIVPEDGMEKIYILSFDYDALLQAHEMAPGLKYILNLEGAACDPAADSILYGYGFSFDRMDRSVTGQTHEFGKRTMIYSCNTREQVAAALDAKTDIILTDNPGVVADFFYNCHHANNSAMTIKRGV